MRVDHPAYGENIDVGHLQTALFQSVADALTEAGEPTTGEQVALVLFGLSRVPSEDFFAACDREVGALTAHYREVAPDMQKETRTKAPENPDIRAELLSLGMGWTLEFDEQDLSVTRLGDDVYVAWHDGHRDAPCDLDTLLEDWIGG